MALEAGTRFGPYEVVEQIGSGGMGEVWLARDTSLKRNVAIKVLPESFAADADRLARFEREAQVLASLNHPNIATIHGLERADNQTVIVMELVDGPTLADRIAEGPLSSDEALAIAAQIADALEAAHGRQIVHRDLKPANIKLREDGTVKVLDFGISKPIDPSTINGGSPVATTPAVTETGVILGTAAYMSPEQARGKFVDQRTDIWAFGCVLFEMLTGQPAFGGEDVMATLARVIDRDTDLSSVPSTLSPAVRQTIKLCLEKDPRKRIADIRDVRLALGGHFTAVSPTPFDISTRGKRWLWPASAAAFVAAALAISFALLPSSSDRDVWRWQVAIPDGAYFDSSSYVRLSPDGRKLAIRATDSDGQTAIWLHDLETGTARRLPGTEGAAGPFWSPNSERLAFGVGPQIKTTSIDGGTPQTLGVSNANVGSGFWTRDGRIVFGGIPTGPLRVISEGGGEPANLTTLDLAAGETGHSLPTLLPNENHYLYFKSTAERGPGIYLRALDKPSDELDDQFVMPARFGAVFVSSRHPAGGHLLYLNEGALIARPFDMQTLRLVGEAHQIADRVGSGGSHGHFSASEEGALAYRVGAGSTRQMVWVDRAGNPIETIGEPGAWGIVSISPDETKAALFRGDSPGVGDIWILDLMRAFPSRLTTGGNVSIVSTATAPPVWSFDSTRVAYRVITTVLEQSVSGIGEPVPLAQTVGAPLAWSRDERFLLLQPAPEVHYIDRTNGDALRPLLRGSGIVYHSAILSRDNRWLAYVSSESGRDEIFLQRIDVTESGIELGPRAQVSTNGGSMARFANNDSEVIYRFLNGPFMSIDVDLSGEAPVFGRPRELFDIDAPDRLWDVTSDGQRFLIGLPVEEETDAPVQFILNWETLLE